MPPPTPEPLLQPDTRLPAEPDAAERPPLAGGAADARAPVPADAPAPARVEAAAAAARATGAAPATRRARAPRPSRRRLLARWWSVGTSWLMGVAVAAALYLSWFTYDQLQHRLHSSSLRFDATMRGFERYWPVEDAAVEATLALRQDLSAPGGPVPATLESDALAFTRRAAALQAETARLAAPLPQAAAVRAAAAGVDAAVADLRASAGGPPRSLALAQARVRAMLDALGALRGEVRRRQSMSVMFLEQVEDVRGQVMLAFALVVALLVAVVGLGARWIAVARRERAIRERAEQLAVLAEAERARAETVARDKARFLGMLSHELLTPLQSILSTMDVIESRGRVDASEPAFTRLRESTRSLRGRISDLVDFAKMSSGRLETRIRGFQVDALVDTALRDLEETLAARNLDVHWEAGPELAQRIYSDPARLRQILDNLLTNAIKYTERGGIAIHVRISEQGDLLRLEVSDTGVGIPADDLAHLFEPFYRSPRTAAMAEGSGLGLAVVRSLVDLMGGSIRVDSTVGRGTSVALEVPIAVGAEAEIEPPMRIDVRRPVLVVDDARDARHAIAEVIRALGIDAHEVDSGERALAQAPLHDYQAILLDMQMPGLSGAEVARRLRRPGGRHEKTFLVLVSAYSELDEASAAALFDARIDKPASRRDLAAALSRAAASSRAPP
jgi:signal transduction histidine kinase/ActR/RegA family two-component response regulator